VRSHPEATGGEQVKSEAQERAAGVARCAAAVALILAGLASCEARKGPARVPKPAVKRADEAALVITNVTVVDVARARLVPGRTIVIRGKTIQRVGPAASVESPPGARVVAGKGRFAIPGLWDMHVHSGAGEVFLPLYVANGITGIRDVGGDLARATGNASHKLQTFLEWRREIEAGRLAGPRILATGPIIDGPKPYWPGVTTPVATPDAARKLVRDLKRRGADFIKTYEKLPLMTYLAIADESKKVGLHFVGHVPEGLTLADVSRAGQRSVEHSDGILDCPRETWPELFALLKRNDTWMVPTLTVKRYLVTHGRDFQEDERLRYVPAYIRAIWKKSWWHEARTARQKAWQARAYAFLEDAAKEMHAAGVGVLAGSDSANPYTYPGFSLHDELARLVAAGLSPAEALGAATTEPARFLGREDELGSIEEGKLADVVILDADPLADIRNTRAVHAVVANGRLFTRGELTRMLGVAAAAAARMTEK
jgi:imidazolonepropionase-like amidohydrolase